MFQFLAGTQAGCRREFPRRLLHRITTLILVAIAGVLSIGPTKTALSAENRSAPNFVFFFIDDMGWKDVGFMGSKYYQTPNTAIIPILN